MGRDVSSSGQLANVPDEASSTAQSSELVRVGYIRNPKSHRNKGIDETGDLAANVTMVEPETPADLEKALASFAQNNIAVLAISGGDGTIRDVLTQGAEHFGYQWPAIVILPQGKTNALASDLGVPKGWTLNQSLTTYASGSSVTRRPLQVERGSEAQQKLYGFILGAGAFNEAISAGQVAHKHGAFQSFAVGMTVGFGVLQALFGFGKSPWRSLTKITINTSTGSLPHSGVCPADSRYFIGFTALRRFPMGVQPFPGLENADAIRYFVIDAPLRRAVLLFPAAVLGWQNKMLAKLGIHQGEGKDFQFNQEDEFILDGERFPAGRFQVQLGPEMHFVAP